MNALDVASPSAAIIDSQSVKTTESGRYDAGKKINGRKRHSLVDTDGRALLREMAIGMLLERGYGKVPQEWLPRRILSDVNDRRGVCDF